MYEMLLTCAQSDLRGRRILRGRCRCYRTTLSSQYKRQTHALVRRDKLYLPTWSAPTEYVGYSSEKEVGLPELVDKRRTETHLRSCRPI